jgi:hypothetical protein
MTRIQAGDMGSEMQSRRGIIKYTVPLAAAVLSGCSEITGGDGGGGIGPQPNLQVTGTDAETTAFGNVRMLVQVTNSGEEDGSGTLEGVVDVQGGDTYRQSRQVSLDAGMSNSYTLEFDIDLGESLSASSYEYRAEVN